MYQLMPLNLMTAGQLGTISQVLGKSDQVHRLHELGIRGGTTVEMVRQGSPCIIRLGSNKLCFRADELTSVLVVPGAKL